MVLKIAPEGYPFIAVFAALAVVVLVVLGPKPMVLPLVLMLFMLFFFRDPERTVPVMEGFISPADGKILSIAPTYEREHLKSNSMKISIFMSPLDVHVNRSPCDAEVLSVKHSPGGYNAAYKEKASLENENTAMLLKCKSGNILVRQVAGFLARRTVNRKSPGDKLERGEKFGIIKFSSRLDIYLPLASKVMVKPDDRVRAGESILAAPPEAK